MHLINGDNNFPDYVVSSSCHLVLVERLFPRFSQQRIVNIFAYVCKVIKPGKIL